jgi:hypothetical protein
MNKQKFRIFSEVIPETGQEKIYAMFPSSGPGPCIAIYHFCESVCLGLVVRPAIPNSVTQQTSESPGGTARIARNSFAVRLGSNG